MKMKMIWNSKFDNKALDETLKQLKELDVTVVIEGVPISWFRNKKFKVAKLLSNSNIIYLTFNYSDEISICSNFFSIEKNLKKWIKKGLEFE